MTRLAVPESRQNLLLGSLPEPEFERIAADLEPVWLEAGDSIYRPHSDLDRFYFLVRGFISLLYVTADGHTTEISLIGNEGGVGVALFLGGTQMQFEATAQVQVAAWTLPRARLQEEFARGEQLQHSLLRFTRALMTQMSQTVVCNRHHTVTLQLCRWILLSLDRLPGNELWMTQQTIAHTLGVRRAGITEAANRLQQAGLIDYRRGHIRVPDRAALEQHACECYGAVREEYDRLREELLRASQPVALPD